MKAMTVKTTYKTAFSKGVFVSFMALFLSFSFNKRNCITTTASTISSRMVVSAPALDALPFLNADL